MEKSNKRSYIPFEDVQTFTRCSRHGIPDVGSGDHIAKPRKSFSARNYFPSTFVPAHFPEIRIRFPKAVAHRDISSEATPIMLLSCYSELREAFGGQLIKARLHYPRG